MILQGPTESQVCLMALPKDGCSPGCKHQQFLKESLTEAEVLCRFQEFLGKGVDPSQPGGWLG